MHGLFESRAFSQSVHSQACSPMDRNWRQAAEPPKTITNTVGMKLVLVPAGEFLMGSPDSDKDAWANEKPQRRVRIAQEFYLGTTEVTVGSVPQDSRGDRAAHRGRDQWQRGSRLGRGEGRING